MQLALDEAHDALQVAAREVELGDEEAPGLAEELLTGFAHAAGRGRAVHPAPSGDDVDARTASVVGAQHVALLRIEALGGTTERGPKLIGVELLQIGELGVLRVEACPLLPQQARFAGLGAFGEDVLGHLAAIALEVEPGAGGQHAEPTVEAASSRVPHELGVDGVEELALQAEHELVEVGAGPSRHDLRGDAQRAMAELAECPRLPRERQEREAEIGKGHPVESVRRNARAVEPLPDMLCKGLGVGFELGPSVEAPRPMPAERALQRVVARHLPPGESSGQNARERHDV